MHLDIKPERNAIVQHGNVKNRLDYMMMERESLVDMVEGGANLLAIAIWIDVVHVTQSQVPVQDAYSALDLEADKSDVLIS